MRNTQNRVAMVAMLSLIGLALLLLSACDTTKLDNGLANVTINITPSINATIFIQTDDIDASGTIDWNESFI